MKKIIFLFFSIAVLTGVYQNSYSQKLRDQLLQDSAGFVYVVGQTKCTQDSDIVIIKYNPTDGSLVWQKKMGFAGYTLFKAADMNNGNIFIVGVNNNLSNKRIVVVKSDLSGNTSYKYFDRAGGDYGNSLTFDNNGNFFVIGRSDLPVSSPKMLIVKYNSNLDSLWSYTYSGALSGAFDEGLHGKTDTSGNIYATGYTSLGQVQYDSYDYLTVKLSPAGTLLWAKKYNSAANKEDMAIRLAVDNSSNVYVTGYSYSSGSSIFTIKYNSNGDSVASATQNCGINSLNRPYDMAIDNSGSLYITGTGQCDAYNYYDFVTVKYNFSLIPQWGTPAFYKGPGNSTPYSLKFSGAYVYVAGESDSSTGARRFMCCKYDAATGLEAWKWALTTSDSNYATSVMVDASNSVYVSGYSSPDTMVTAKYNGWRASYGFCPPFGIRIISTIVPKNYDLLQNFPNPFNPVTKIRFDIVKRAQAKIVIYDAIGRKIDELVNEELAPGIYEATWDGSEHESGVYFVQLYTEGYSATKKMVLVK